MTGLEYRWLGPELCSGPKERRFPEQDEGNRLICELHGGSLVDRWESVLVRYVE